MKIALINASPKFKESASGSLLEIMKDHIGDRAEVSEYGLHRPDLSDDDLAGLDAAEAWVFLFPLYVDGIPSHMLSCLSRLEERAGGSERRRIYSVVNLGFYEGIQADIALDIMKNWSERCGFKWCGGMGVGGAGGLAYMPPMPPDKGPMAPIDKALGDLCEAVLSQTAAENTYISIGFPRFLYRMGAQLGWRKAIKNNGLKKRDLGRKPELE